MPTILIWILLILQCAWLIVVLLNLYEGETLSIKGAAFLVLPVYVCTIALLIERVWAGF